MGYQFTKHSRSFFRAWRHTPLFFLAQLPEAVVSAIQKFGESYASDYPLVSFLILYPLYCAATALGAALTYLTLTQSKNSSLNVTKLLLVSLCLGLIMIPATLALLLPGVYVLATYLFLPYLVVDSPKRTYSEFFFESKSLFLKARGICLLTAAVSFVFGALGYFVPSFLTDMTEATSLGLFFEIGIGILLSLILNVWTATLYMEVSDS